MEERHSWQKPGRGKKGQDLQNGENAADCGQGQAQMSLSVLKEFRFCPSGRGVKRDPGQFLDRGKSCLDLCLFEECGGDGPGLGEVTGPDPELSQ